MGRKTWESIPPKFRPLKNRLNVVLSRSKEWTASAATGPGMVCVGSLDEAVELLRRRFVSGGLAVGSSSDASENTLPSSPSQDVARAFVIGGAEVYRAALEMPETDSVLLTRVHGEWECDAFFPVNLDKDTKWERRSLEELKEWTGEESIPEEIIKEGDVEFEYRLYSRR
jgi:dihydrofolate reductase